MQYLMACIPLIELHQNRVSIIQIGLMTPGGNEILNNVIEEQMKIATDR
jgi:hypothetical protein